MLTEKSPLLTPCPLPPDKRQRRGSFARAAGSFVPKIAAKAFEKFGFHTAEIMTAWARIAGADIAAWTSPERLRWPRLPQGVPAADGGSGAERPGGTLVLRVEPARALDVEYRGAEIIDRVNRYFGYRAVETLKIIQAPITHVAPCDSPLESRLPDAGSAPPSGSQPHSDTAPTPETALDLNLTGLNPGDPLKAALEALAASVAHRRT